MLYTMFVCRIVYGKETGETQGLSNLILSTNMRYQYYTYIYTPNLVGGLMIVL